MLFIYLAFYTGVSLPQNRVALFRHLLICSHASDSI